MREFFTTTLMLCLFGYGSATAGPVQSSSPAIARLYVPQSERPFTPLRDHNPMKLATGEECPNQSGSYCSNEFPVCCLVSGEYACYAKREDCKEK